MNKRSKDLCAIAIDYLDTCSIQGDFATVGGSVGRGEADSYSDIDLIVYTDHLPNEQKYDEYYKGEIVQVDVLPSNQKASRKTIVQFPWDHRFLIEQVAVKDLSNDEDLLKWAKVYLQSKDAKHQMYRSVEKIVRERQTFGVEAFVRGSGYSANVALMGAWAEAGFLSLFLHENELATGKLLSHIKQHLNYDSLLLDYCPFSIDIPENDLLQIVHHFRHYLKEAGHHYNELDRIHDHILERKVNRLKELNEKSQVRWILYGEAVSLYFGTAKGKSLDEYVLHLPKGLREDLQYVGFSPLKEKQVNRLRELSEQLLSHAVINNLM